MDQSRVFPLLLALLLAATSCDARRSHPMPSFLDILLRLQNNVCADVTCDNNQVCIAVAGRAECMCPLHHGGPNCVRLAPLCDTTMPQQCDLVVQSAVYYNPRVNQCQNVHQVVCREKVFTSMANCTSTCVL